MWTEDLPIKEIAQLFGRDAEEVEGAYEEWLASRQGRRQPVKPDNRLLALLSGLSTTSISNFVQNKPGSLSGENWQRLSKLVDIVGYVPSQAAQSLRSRRHNTVGVVLPLSSVSPVFYLEVLKGIKERASFFGFRRLIYDVTMPEERDDFFSDMPFLDVVDGLVVVGLFISESQLRIMERHQLPLVVVHNRLSRNPVVANIIDLDESELRSLIDQHLIKHHGYRRLALVTLDTSSPLKMGENTQGDWNRVARKKAYQDALRMNGLDPDELVFTVEEHSFEAGCSVFEQICQKNTLLAPDERIQAVVCLSDTLAAAILTCARQAGTEIAVTGYDNLSIADLHGITTIDQKARLVGALAFQHLFNALEYRGRTGTLPWPLVEEAIGMEAVIRTSCGCLLAALEEYNDRLLERRIPTWIPPEDIPGPKFYPNGDTKPFYGLTCIAWIDQESELFRKLCALQKVFREEFEQAGLGGAFAFLEPESFHMTVCDIVDGSDPIQPRRANTLIQQVQRAFEQSERSGKVTSLIKGIGLKQTITALVRFDSKPQELGKVLALERKIKQATGESVREFTGHISLAYLVRHPGNDADKIKQILLPYEERVFGEFAFSQFDLTYFTDMNTYMPILTIDLQDGAVTCHDRLKERQSRI